MLNKPAWLSCRDYGLFLEKWADANGFIQCNHPNCSREADTIDHIESRTSSRWARCPEKAHQLNNLQPMCRPHNSQKGTSEDIYWSKKLYFDHSLDLTKLRASQRDFVYYPIIEYSEFFASGFSQINGKLYAFLQVTGAGKSIGMFVLPFAINQACLNYSQTPNKRPRISRMLILVKDKTLRDQLARELKEEPIKFGIVRTPPNVQVAHGSDDLMNCAKKMVDIVVCCVQSIWKCERSIPDLRHFLAQFELIVFDEFHYAHGQVGSVVQQAEHSIVAGFTATPLSATGDLLADIVKVTSYGYYQACAQDNSMKSLGEATDGGRQLNPEFEDIIEEIEPEEIKDIQGRYILPDEISGWTLPSMLNVGSATIERLTLLDKRGYDRQVSGHRARHHSMAVKGIEASEEFPAHAIIRTPDIKMAEYLTNWLNSRFEQDRVNYPLEKGYRAICAHGDHADYPRQQLDESDWFWSLNHGGKLSSQAARILVVSNLAKEGTNNRYCNIVAWGKVPKTDREIVQATGRGIRSCHMLDEDGCLRVPDHMLDRLYVITHQLWGEGDTFSERQQPLINALRYLENAERLDDDTQILTIDQWLTPEVDDDTAEAGEAVDIQKRPYHRPMDEVLQIVHLMAKAHQQGTPLRLAEVHDVTHAVSPIHRKEQSQLIENMARGEVEALKWVNRRLGTLSVLGPELARLVVEENVNTHIEGEQAVLYVTQIEGCETLKERYSDDLEALQILCDSVASHIRAGFYQSAEIVLPHTLTEVVERLALRLSAGLSRSDLEVESIKLVWEGLNILVGRQDDDPIPEHSRYNQPEIIIHLEGQVYQAKIIGHVIRRLHQQGLIDAEAFAMGLDAALSGELFPDDHESGSE